MYREFQGLENPIAFCLCYWQSGHSSAVNLGEFFFTKMSGKFDTNLNFQFQHNANLKQTDHEGRTCLTYAKAANSLAIVKQSNAKPHHVTAETTTALVNLLQTLGCTDPHPLTGSTNSVGPHPNSGGTLSRRRETIGSGPASFEKVPSSVI